MRATRREHALYTLGAGGVAVHAVDHLVSDPEWRFLFTGAVALSAATVAIAVVYPWLPPWCREAAALPLGLLWAAAALVHHVIGLFVGGPAPTDYTGIPATIGGVLIVWAGLLARGARRASAPASAAG